MAEAEKNAVATTIREADRLSRVYPVKVDPNAESDRVLKVKEALAYIGAITTDGGIDKAIVSIDQQSAEMCERKKVLQLLRKVSPATRSWLVEFIRVGRGAV